jgi:hypothetical protein
MSPQLQALSPPLSSDAKKVAPAFKKLTSRRFVKLTIWWLVLVLAGIVSVAIGAVWGAIQGVGQGVAKMIGDTIVDMRKVWEWVEK